ncbi:MAG: FAD-dependent oxidoreductase [Solirubrobacteraceae bacterium]|nr:FAD-dependent oxidoreductase [Solirubrobacteraceae bacterium]
MEHTHQPRVVIVGGGVGAIEAALALRALAGPIPTIELISPDDTFVYRPLTVTEPFGAAPTAEFPLAELRATHGVRHRRGAVAAVHPADHALELESGDRIGYDALLVAVGARPQAWLDGAVTFRGHSDVQAVKDVLAGIRDGAIDDLVFAAPPGASWTLPLYELALLSAAWIADAGITNIRLSLATKETDPLADFGPAAAKTVRDLLGDRGVRFHHVQATDYQRGLLSLEHEPAIRADAVITMAELTGNPLPGLPQTEDGFIPTDELAAVIGVEDVWAVGDATNYPVKQGGLAAQQADTAATAIAATLGVPVTAEASEPVMRGLLLTGVTSAYLRGDKGSSDAAFNPLWWPPTKLAGRYLAPYLADHHQIDPAKQELQDRKPTRGAAEDREEVRRLAIDFAEADAAWGDYRSALRWLRTIEWVDGALPAKYAELERRWQEELVAH